jgi:hypothetical protein
MILPISGLSSALAGASAKEERMKRALETFCTQPETRVDFFYFFARNPLKSSNSGEQNQGNPRFFAWFCLDLLGENSRSG